MMSPSSVQASTSLTTALMPVAGRFIPASPPSPPRNNVSSVAITAIADPSSLEQEANRRWQLHQQQSASLTYPQKRGIALYQSSQVISALSGWHIEV